MGYKEEKDEESGFQYAGKAIKANRRRRKGRDRDAEEDRGEILIQRMGMIKAKKDYLLDGSTGDKVKALLDSSFPLDSPKAVQTPSSILMLGLGSVSISRASQMQLAFLLLIRDRLKKTIKGDVNIEAFDPIFNDDDRQLLVSFNIDVSDDNKQGAYVFEVATFVYMPHCTKTLYEIILRSNWTEEGLQRLWLCCNDLERYTHFRDQDRSTPCIDRVVPYLFVNHLPKLPSPNDTALNDLAIQYFDNLKMTALDELADQFEKIDVQSKEQGENASTLRRSFWILPEESLSIKMDPELL